MHPLECNRTFVYLKYHIHTNLFQDKKNKWLNSKILALWTSNQPIIYSNAKQFLKDSHPT